MAIETFSVRKDDIEGAEAIAALKKHCDKKHKVFSREVIKAIKEYVKCQKIA